MRAALRALEYVGATALAAAVSFALFIIIPALHSLFGVRFDESRSAQGGRVVMEATPQQREQKQRRQRARTVRPVPSGQRGGQQRSLSAEMKFVPDLAADGASGDGVALQSNELGAEVLEEGQTDEDARPQYTPAVAYPDRARELGVTGLVEALFVVNHAGRVVSVEIVRAPHPSLADEVRRKLAVWRFSPARNKGIPVNVRMRKTFEFKLEG